MQLMVVDDSAMVRERLAGLLCGIDGVQAVLQADCGQQAMELLQQDTAGAVRFIVLDIEMPGESGLQVLQRIKSSRGDICVAMFTQHANSQHRARSLDGGADYFFDKSSDIDRLETLVRQLAAQPH
ncbi:MAG: response regulator transcription factor [Betaproteobacteria bacterium]|jgi:Response regulator containing a CheY-like receiver domain and an HTH DNA-binding domain|nr:response regulator transcription factor [Betaproteobacteria bacterium]